MDTSSQVVILWAVNNGYLDNVPIEELSDTEEKILALFTTNKKLKDHLDKNKEIDDFVQKELEKMLKSLTARGDTTGRALDSAQSQVDNSKSVRVKKKTST